MHALFSVTTVKNASVKQVLLTSFSTESALHGKTFIKAKWHDKLLTRLSSLHIFYADEILTDFVFR